MIIKRDIFMQTYLLRLSSITALRYFNRSLNMLRLLLDLFVTFAKLLPDCPLTSPFFFHIQVLSRVTKDLQAQVIINQLVDYHHYYND